MTYLYATLGMAMLIPILASLEMAGALLQQQGLMGPLPVSSSDLEAIQFDKRLMEYLNELREDRGAARSALSQELSPGTSFCNGLGKDVRRRLGGDPNSIFANISFEEGSVWDGSVGCSANGVGSWKVMVLGGAYTGNSPKEPFKDYGLLSCDADGRSSCAF
jgi:hypothetical protein